jgi:hypothetical protein
MVMAPSVASTPKAFCVEVERTRLNLAVAVVVRNPAPVLSSHTVLFARAIALPPALTPLAQWLMCELEIWTVAAVLGFSRMPGPVQFSIVESLSPDSPPQ